MGRMGIVGIFKRWSQGICVGLAIATLYGWMSESLPRSADLYLIAVPGLIAVFVCSTGMERAVGVFAARMLEYVLFICLVGVCYRLGAGYAHRTGCTPPSAVEFQGWLTATIVWPLALVVREGIIRIFGRRDDVEHDEPVTRL